MEEFWQTCAQRLQQELTPQQYSAWIKPLAPLDYEEGRLRIAAPNRFKLDWVKTQFAARITSIAAEFWQSPVDVQFVLDPRGAVAKRPAGGAPAVLAPPKANADVAEPGLDNALLRD
ncbi:MAG: DnaA N-terminal domain-containing protein, partial [Burkholderiaceae bacterium]